MKPRMTFTVLGTSEFALCCAKAMLASGAGICEMVSMPRAARPENSADIAAFAGRHGIAYREVSDINSSASVRRLKAARPDHLFVSWPKLLHRAALAAPRYFSIGTHPTDLPHNRGRHPLHWLIALGISETKLSFFRMNARADDGPILLKTPFKVGKSAPIAEVIGRMNAAAARGTRALCAMLKKNPSARGKKQTGRANAWRKRTPHDVTIDFRMSADAIVRLVRSFGLPYPCANLVFRDLVIKVTDAAAVPSGKNGKEMRNMEHGRIMSVRGNRIRVKADDGVVELRCRGPVPAKLRRAEFIHPPAKYAPFS